MSAVFSLILAAPSQRPARLQQPVQFKNLTALDHHNLQKTPEKTEVATMLQAPRPGNPDCRPRIQSGRQTSDTPPPIPPKTGLLIVEQPENQMLLPTCTALHLNAILRHPSLWAVQIVVITVIKIFMTVERCTHRQINWVCIASALPLTTEASIANLASTRGARHTNSRSLLTQPGHLPPRHPAHTIPCPTEQGNQWFIDRPG